MQSQTGLSQQILDLVTFRKQSSLQLINELADESQKEMLASTTWIIKKSYQSWAGIFAQISAVSISKLNLNDKLLSIPPEICTIDFRFLSELYLESNKLQNIEALMRINASKLKTLYLHDNNITHLKSIRKTHFPLMSKLSFESNKNLMMEHLFEMQHAREMKYMSLQYAANEVVWQDLGLYVKMDFIRFDYFCCQSHARLSQNKHKIALVAKCKSLSIFTSFPRVREW